VGHPPHPRPLGIGFLDDALLYDGTVQPPVRATVFHGWKDDVVPLDDVTGTIGGLTGVDLRIRDDDHGLRRTLPEIAAYCHDRARVFRDGSSLEEG